jgi:Ca-activated chloride channel family protein
VSAALALTLLSPAWLAVLLLLVPALVLRIRRGGPSILFAPGGLLGRRQPADPDAPPVFVRGPQTWRTRLRHLPRTLQVLGLVLLGVALARPAVRTELPRTHEGIDILLCLDVSSSMTATDLDEAGERTRLDVSRDAAAEFVRDRPSDRIGLITFARYPDLRCPLTRDHEALGRILSAVATVTSDGPEDATGLGTAIAGATKILADSGAVSRVVILLTDGEENVALAGKKGEIAPVHAAQLAARLGVRVYTIVAGIGRTGPDGAWVELDTRAVQHVARRTGGGFFRARDADALTTVYAEIDEMEKAPLEEPRYVFADRFLPFLIAALFLLLASRVLATTVWDVLP